MGPIGHPHWLDHPKCIWWGIQIMNPLSVYFSPVFCWFLSDRPDYLSHNPVLEHPQPLFFPQYERPGFTPIWSSGQNWMFVGRQKITDRLRAAVPRNYSDLRKLLLMCYCRSQIHIRSSPNLQRRAVAMLWFCPAFCSWDISMKLLRFLRIYFHSSRLFND
jgi:hypothetical protein